MKRRDFLGVSAAALASTPIRSLAQGHGPADEVMPPININAPSNISLPVPSPGGPAGEYYWQAGGDNIRGGIFQIGRFRLVNGRKYWKLPLPESLAMCFPSSHMELNLQTSR